MQTRETGRDQAENGGIGGEFAQAVRLGTNGLGKDNLEARLIDQLGFDENLLDGLGISLSGLDERLGLLRREVTLFHKNIGDLLGIHVG